MNASPSFADIVLALAVHGLAALLVVAVLAVPAQAQSGVAARIEAAADTPHPRLLFTADDVDRVEQNIQVPLLKPIYEAVAAGADAALTQDPVERELEGRRLLGVSRTALQRITYLSFMYRMTGETSYAERAEAEMLAAADFTDWNPSHFLDVGEMTAALAIGYDWVHDALSETSRQTIRQAIIEKGLKASFEREYWWISDGNNWNQVCHGGLTLGALAVMDHAPALATDVIGRAVENVRIPMAAYGPHGGYVEGPTYWSYGTHYNVLFLDALETALGSTFGLTTIEPFMKSPDFYLHAHAPTLQLFSFSDSGITPSLAPAMHWFARQLDRPGLLWMERRKLAQVAAGPDRPDGRLLPMLLVWTGAAHMQADEVPTPLHYQDTGPLALGLHRSDWDEQATFIGIEGGTAGGAHAHMDAGAFVMEADGVRWGLDLKRPDYHPLEEAGIALWNFEQDSERWSIYRLNNFSHNTLVVNGERQRVDGFADVVNHEGEGATPHTILDLSAVYAGQLAAAQRGIALVDGQAVRVQDEIAAPTDAPAAVRWAMMTRADVQITGDRTATLTQDGQTLSFRVLEPAGARVETYATEPPAAYEPSNEGARLVGFTTNLDAGAEARLVVALAPGDYDGPPPPIEALADW